MSDNNLRMDPEKSVSYNHKPVIAYPTQVTINGQSAKKPRIDHECGPAQYSKQKSTTGHLPFEVEPYLQKSPNNHKDEILL